MARADRAAERLDKTNFVADLTTVYALPQAPAPGTIERVAVLGIGGSAAGSRCVQEACGSILPLHVVDNIDPASLRAALDAGDPARTAWVVISKSGGTTETMAQCAVVREHLRARVGAQAGHGQTYVVTGPDGPLRALAEADDLPLFDVPVPVGGRFSVFTPAATVPLALAGVDVAKLLEGARVAARQAAEPGSASSLLAAHLVAAELSGRNVVALWAYAERLESIGEWFRQLWAESLGKVRADGTRAGQTPLHCVGSTDQHSIQQLMVEGPRDKVALVIGGPPEQGWLVPPGAGIASGHEMGAILEAMRRATSAEMVRSSCPVHTLLLDAYDPASVGALLMTFLCATVVAGELLDVDPFGQPGVEAAKRTAKALLTDPGGAMDRETAVLLGEAKKISTGM